MTRYEITVGLEVHVELATKTKIFCGCSTAFGAPPNTHTCAGCLGHPGTLPVLNRRAVELAAMAGLALGAQIREHTWFDRKQYFYPDLPKAYQTSQIFAPLCYGGGLSVPSGEGERFLRIKEIHMEEDAGKLLHDPWQDATLIDYNRGGVPLIEIVTEPDFHTAEEVVAFLETLRERLVYIGVTDGKMQEGSLRADVNLSVQRVGTQGLGVRTEMKNLSSFKAIARAVAGEAQRHIEVLEEGGTITQQTRRWDENKDASIALRSKEEARDYRYFPDPDLPPLHLRPEWVEALRATLPETAEEKRTRFVKGMGLSPYDAAVLTAQPAVCFAFEELAAFCGNAKEAANLWLGDGLRLGKEGATIPPAAHLAAILAMVAKGQINRTMAKEVIEAVFLTGVVPSAYVAERGLSLQGDEGTISEAVRTVCAQEAASVEAFRAGKEKVLGHLVGAVMRQLHGKADPVIVNRLLLEEMGRAMPEA